MLTIPILGNTLFDARVSSQCPNERQNERPLEEVIVGYITLVEPGYLVNEISQYICFRKESTMNVIENVGLEYIATGMVHVAKCTL